VLLDNHSDIDQRLQTSTKYIQLILGTKIKQALILLVFNVVAFHEDLEYRHRRHCLPQLTACRMAKFFQVYSWACKNASREPNRHPWQDLISLTALASTIPKIWMAHPKFKTDHVTNRKSTAMLPMTFGRGLTPKTPPIFTFLIAFRIFVMGERRLQFGTQVDRPSLRTTNRP